MFVVVSFQTQSTVSLSILRVGQLIFTFLYLSFIVRLCANLFEPNKLVGVLIALRELFLLIACTLVSA